MAALAHVMGAVGSRRSVWLMPPLPLGQTCRRIPTWGKVNPRSGLLARDFHGNDLPVDLTFNRSTAHDLPDDLSSDYLSSVYSFLRGQLMAPLLLHLWILGAALLLCCVLYLALDLPARQ